MEERPRPSSTVLLLRDGAQGPEVWVQERAATMPDFPGMTVFPGGGVDRRDVLAPQEGDGSALWSGSSPAEIARVIGVEPGFAQAVVFSAVRELFEETGTLLAADSEGQTVADATPLHADRLALESHRVSLSDMLRRRSLRVDATLLRPWSRWIGASENGRAFDTIFFLAMAPRGQEADGATPEADSAGWLPPRLLIDGWRHGLVRLAIPTWAQLDRLSRCDSAEEAFAEAKEADFETVVGSPEDDPRYREFYAHPAVDRISPWS